MKGKSLFLTAAALSLVLSILACITSTPTPNNPPAPPATNPPAPVVPTDTLAPTATEVPTDTEQPPLPTLGPGPSQPSAPPHFHAGEIIKLTQVKMISTTKGWGLVGAYVLTTSDGGHTWKEVTPPQSFTDPTKGKAYGIFLDEKTAWVIFSENDQIAPEASVWSTTDGGQTWTPSAPLMHQVNAEVLWGEFAAHGTQSGWLLLRGVYMGAGTHYVAQLFHTADGGQTWTDLQPSLDLNYDMTSMVFADGQNGWLAWQTTGAYGPGAPDYAVTGDGGASWNSLELPAPPEAPNLFSDYDYAEPYQVNLLSPTSVRLLVGAFSYGDPPNKFVSYLYSSEDGGSTWTTAVLPADVLASNYTLIFFDGQNGLLLGKESYKTTDGGAHWQHVSTVYWDGQYSFVDQQNGWAIATMGSQSSLVHSTNGGATWNIIQTTVAP